MFLETLSIDLDLDAAWEYTWNPSGCCKCNVKGFNVVSVGETWDSVVDFKCNEQGLTQMQPDWSHAIDPFFIQGGRLL